MNTIMIVLETFIIYYPFEVQTHFANSYEKLLRVIPHNGFNRLDIYGIL